MDEKEDTENLSPSRGSSIGYSICSTPEEVDVVGCTPKPQIITESDQKRYFCQRCLNHEQQHPRKGHKPFCQYASCSCSDCRMVEERRRLNNMLSIRRLDPSHASSRSINGKKIRDPKCALCSAHGNKQPLRGHKKAQCPFLKCGCHLCDLVENRRTLMARQIKLRRDQQKQRKVQLNTQRCTEQAPERTPIESEDLVKKHENQPLRVPALMPVVIEPSSPPHLQPAAQSAPIIMHSSTLFIPQPATRPAPPIQTIDSSDSDEFYIRFMQYGLMNPHPIPFPPIFSYVPTMQFSSIP